MPHIYMWGLINVASFHDALQKQPLPFRKKTEQKTVAPTHYEGCLGLEKHLIYVAISLEAYISIPIFCKDKIYGTLNFSNNLIGMLKLNLKSVTYRQKTTL